MLRIFFFNDTATTEIYTLSLHDALPIWGGDDRPRAGQRAHGGPHAARQAVRGRPRPARPDRPRLPPRGPQRAGAGAGHADRSEEHTSELQSRQYLVCRLLLEKKKNKKKI